MRTPIRDVFGKKILIMDGAMGTLLIEQGVPPDSCFEKASLDYPQIIKKVHKAYIEAGADIIETNSFGGSPLKLADYGLADNAYELNKAAAILAREAAGNDHYVAGSMGPSGKLIEPLGSTSFEEVYESYAIQAKGLRDGGVDIVSIETMGDLQEIKAAVLAVKDNTDLPIICSVTFDENFLSMTGSDPYIVYVTLAAMGVDVIGSNCSMGPEGLLTVIKKFREAKESNPYSPELFVMPNAGLPKLVNNKAVYDLEAGPFGAYIQKFLEQGVTVIGGCCGTTPDHIRSVKKNVGSTVPVKLTTTSSPLTVLTSRSKRIMVSDNHLPLVIGERLNPTARKVLSEDLIEQTTDRYKQEARAQIEAGADLLDVNVGYPEINEAVAMQDITSMLVQNFDIPLCLDSSSPEVLEAGLKAYPGKALINSVNGEEASLSAVLPLAKKYGAAVIGLTLDERGIPKTAEERLLIARRITERAESLGIKKSDIFVDTLVLAASSNQKEVLETVKAIQMVKRELGVRTSLGVSNISHGLPLRKLINHTFLAMALGAGLDAVIINPLDPYIHSVIASAAVLTGRDTACKNFIENSSSYLVAEPGAGGQKAPAVVMQEAEALKLEALKSHPVLYEIARDVIEGNEAVIVDKVIKALTQYDPQQIIEDGLLIAMDDVGAKFKTQKIFLPQVMASAETMKKAFGHIKAVIPPNARKSRGKVIIATVKGDIHDIGKNIVSMMLENNGFDVVDLGKNVDSDEIVAAVKEHNADIVCLSSLLTTTMGQMEVIKQKLDDQGLTVDVMVGGAVVTDSFAGRIKAHYSADAIGAAEKAKQLAGNG